MIHPQHNSIENRITTMRRGVNRSQLLGDTSDIMSGRAGADQNAVARKHRESIEKMRREDKEAIAR